MRRRGFLKLSLISSLGLVSVGGAAALCGRLGIFGDGGGEPSAAGAEALLLGELRVLTLRQLWVLRAAALRILDGAELASPRSEAPLAVAADGLYGHCRFIDGYLAGLDPPLRRDVGALLELLECYPLLRGKSRRFTRLTAAEQDALLDGWQRSRFALLRQAFAGLKSLCMLAHYQDPRSFAAIGYSGPLI